MFQIVPLTEDWRPWQPWLSLSYFPQASPKLDLDPGPISAAQSQWCHNRASLSLTTALPCPAIGPTKLGPPMGWCPSPTSAHSCPRKVINVWGWVCPDCFWVCPVLCPGQEDSPGCQTQPRCPRGSHSTPNSQEDPGLCFTLTLSNSDICLDWRQYFTVHIPKHISVEYKMFIIINLHYSHKCHVSFMRQIKRHGPWNEELTI